MARTDAEKYTTHRSQDQNGRWFSYRTINHDTRYCDICDSEDVEHGDPHSVNGWSGGVKAFFRGGQRLVVTDVLCREHKVQHVDAEQSAPRTEIEVLGYNGPEMERAYFCPAHQTDHFER